MLAENARKPKSERLTRIRAAPKALSKPVHRQRQLAIE